MSSSVNVLYRTSASATGGRDGKASTLDGAFAVGLSTPTELGGPGGAGSNPEQLFAAGYAACFLNGMKLIAREAKLAFPDNATVTSTIGIGPRAAGGFGLTAALAVSIPGMDRHQADGLIKQTDRVCPYSNAVRGNVDVTFTLT